MTSAARAGGVWGVSSVVHGQGEAIGDTEHVKRRDLGHFVWHLAGRSGRLLPRSDLWPISAIRTSIERRQRGPIARESGWGNAFFRYPDHQVHLGLRLMDGTHLYGRLLTFSPQIEENDDRSLQLAGPVEIRTPSAEAPEPMEAGVVVVSARAIKTMSVHYLPDC